LRGSAKEEYKITQIRRWVVSDKEDVCQIDFGEFREEYLILGTPKKHGNAYLFEKRFAKTQVLFNQ